MCFHYTDDMDHVYVISLKLPIIAVSTDVTHTGIAATSPRGRVTVSHLLTILYKSILFLRFIQIDGSE